MVHFIVSNIISKIKKINKKYSEFSIKQYTDNEVEHNMILVFKFPFGSKKILNSNSDSNLFKPLDNIINEGKPIEKLVYVLYHEAKDEIYFLGTFIKTSKRILFFPALVFSKIEISNGNQLETPMNLNHLTLEENLIKWHITTDEKKIDKNIKFNSYQIYEINQDNHLWFVMCLQSENTLENLPGKLEILLDCPSSSELKRRFDIIENSRKNSEFPITFVKQIQQKPYFLNFEFFITSNFEILKEKNYLLPQQIFTATKNLGNIQNQNNIKSRFTPIKIEGFNRLLVVRTSKIKGILKFPAIFISGNTYSSK